MTVCGSYHEDKLLLRVNLFPHVSRGLLTDVGSHLGL